MSVPATGSHEAAVKAERLLSEYLRRYEANNTVSKTVIQDGSKYLPGGTTRAILSHNPFPLVIDSGKGAELTSVDGRVYLDFVSEYFAGLYGHSHPDILAAIEETTKKGLNYGAPHRYEAEFAKLLVEKFPSIDKARIVCSATEANIFAVAAALHFTRRSRVLVFENGYHGGGLSFTSADARSPLNIPHDYVYGIFNDLERTRAVLEGPDSNEIGVILIEPMQGSGGGILGDKTFFQYLRDTATRLGAILIFDETITSRFAYGGLQDYLGVTPDMTTMGKHFGGGFSFGAYGGRDDIMALFDPASPTHLHQSGTFSNNVFTVKVGLVGIRLMTAERLGALNALGDKLREQFSIVLAEKDPSGKLVTIGGFGSIVTLIWTSPAAAAHRNLIYHFMLEKGIFIGKRGFFGLNFAHTEEHIDRVAQAFAEFIGVIVAL
ncbi:hypothetical protein ACJ41O_006586 [Fusarium nematophilum]